MAESSKSTVRIVNQAIALLEGAVKAPDNDHPDWEGDLDMNLTELKMLAAKLHRKYPIMRPED